jgi:hypothetical protein
VSAYISRYETSPLGTRSDTAGIYGGLTWDYSESLKSAISLGLRSTKTTTQSQTLRCVSLNFWPDSCDFGFGSFVVVSETREERKYGSTLNLSMVKRFEASTLTAKILREVSPSSIGLLVESDSISLSATHSLDTRLRGSLSFYARSNRYISDITTTNNDRYQKIESALTWDISEWWTMDAAYSYARQKYELASTDATANMVYVNFTYAWPKVSISR